MYCMFGRGLKQVLTCTQVARVLLGLAADAQARSARVAQGSSAAEALVSEAEH